MGIIMYVILGSATGLKVVLYILCAALRHGSDSMMALAEDHRNDIISNAAAIACGAVASQWRKLWYVDPLGGILASIYIIWSWALICKAQVPLPFTSCPHTAKPVHGVRTLEQTRRYCRYCSHAQALACTVNVIGELLEGCRHTANEAPAAQPDPAQGLASCLLHVLTYGRRPHR